MGFFDHFKENPWHLIIALMVLSIAVIFLGHKWRDAIQKPLTKSFLKLPEATFDGWSLLHAGLFALFGFIQPGKFLQFAAIGAGWEMAEDYLAKDEVTHLDDCSMPSVINSHGKEQRKLWCNGIQTDYWYGKWDDILANSVGYVIHSVLPCAASL